MWSILIMSAHGLLCDLDTRAPFAMAASTFAMQVSTMRSTNSDSTKLLSFQSPPPLTKKGSGDIE